VVVCALSFVCAYRRACCLSVGAVTTAGRSVPAPGRAVGLGKLARLVGHSRSLPSASPRCPFVLHPLVTRGDATVVRTAVSHPCPAPFPAPLPVNRPLLVHASHASLACVQRDPARVSPCSVNPAALRGDPRVDPPLLCLPWTRRGLLSCLDRESSPAPNC
jgi:hypothetical protein